MMGFVQNLVTPTVQYQGDVAAWRDGFFVLDNWQASRKLTINYGIRYELQTVPYSVAGFARELNAAQTAAGAGHGSFARASASTIPTTRASRRASAWPTGSPTRP